MRAGFVISCSERENEFEIRTYHDFLRSGEFKGLRLRAEVKHLGNARVVVFVFVYNNIAKLAKLIKHCELPDCFVCANDFLALMLLDALNTLEIHVPERIKVLGYENSAESKISKPTLSTINVNKTNLGKELIHTLINRMNNRQQKTRFIYIKDIPVRRETTNMI